MRKRAAFLLLPLLIGGCLVLIFSLRREPPYRMDLIDPETLTGEYDIGEQVAYFNNRPLNVPQKAGLGQEPVVLGNTRAYKWVEVDLTNQRLYAYEDGRKIYDFPISSGKYGRTPTGVFRIWTKLRYTKMSGGSKENGTYYYLPNVPYTMFFYNDEVARDVGYAIHGAYWHMNFGHPMSHGCINMNIEEAGQVYYWAQPDLRGKSSIRATEDNPGTLIYIYGTAPWE